MPAALGLLVAGGLLAAFALSGKKKAPPPAAPPGFPPWSGTPGIPGSQPPLVWPFPIPGSPAPGAPPLTSASGCALDATLPPSMLPMVDALLSRTDINAGQLMLASQAARLAGYPKTADCLAARAGQLGQAQPPPAGQTSSGGWPAEPPPWWLPWMGAYPPPFPYPGAIPGLPGATPPSAPGGGQQPPPPAAPADSGGWGPLPAGLPAGFPWPPPIPFPAAGTPKPTWWDAGPGAWGLPWPAGAEPIPPGGVEPEADNPPLGYPSPPTGKAPNPTDNPIVNGQLEARFGAGDTYYGWAAYYAGIPMLSGTPAENLATLRIGNAHLGDGSSVAVGTPIYLPLTWVAARGLPPKPTGVYQAAGGYVP